MKEVLIFLLLIATAFAFSEKDIPAHMRDRLDDYIRMKKIQTAKWNAMSDEDKENYDLVFSSRLQHFPEIELVRLHELVTSMSNEEKVIFRRYLKESFPMNDDSSSYSSNLEEIEAILRNIPLQIREYIHAGLNFIFRGAPLYMPVSHLLL